MNNSIIDKDFDESLKKRYENHAIEPDKALWEGINARLYQKKFNRSNSKVRNLKATIALLAMLLVVIFIYYQTKTQKYQPGIRPVSEIAKITVSFDKSNENLPTVKQDNNTHREKTDSDNNIQGLVSNSSITAFSENATKKIKFTDNQITENKELQSEQEEVSAFYEKNEITKGTEPDSYKFIKPVDSILPYIIRPDIEKSDILQIEDIMQISQVYKNQDKSNLNSSELIQNIAHSEEPGTNRSEMRRFPFFIEGFVSPEISYRALTANPQYSVPEYGTTYFNRKEKADFTFSTGISGGFGISRNIVLCSGIFYSKYSLKFKTEAIHLLNTGSVWNFIYTSSGPVNLMLLSSDSLTDESFIKSSLNFLYLNIPLIAELHFKNNYFLDAGVNFNMLVGQNMNWEAENYDGDFSNTFGDSIDGLEKGSISIIIGLGTIKTINHNLSLIINPSLRICLSSINNSAPVKSYPYSWGLNAGLRYYFN